MTEAAAGSGACTGDSALCCADTPCSTSRGAAAAAVHSCDFGTPTSAIAQCVPEAAPPHTSDDDTVSTVFWRFCGGPCTMPSPPPVVCTRQSLRVLLSRWCWQMLAPPHSLHSLLRRWCWQMPAPPHSLHVLLLRWCGQRPPLRVAFSAVAPAVAPDPLRRARFAELPPVCVPPAARLAPASEPSAALSASMVVQRF